MQGGDPRGAQHHERPPPPVLEELGLVPVVEEELRSLESDTGWRVQSSVRLEERLPREVELVLYRILHEALINARRHSSASKVTASLGAGTAVVLLEVADDGVGFDVQAMAQQRRMGGLTSMQRRAAVAGGSCQLESEPRRGTRVVVAMPLEPSGREAWRGDAEA